MYDRLLVNVLILDGVMGLGVGIRVGLMGVEFTEGGLRVMGLGLRVIGLGVMGLGFGEGGWE